MFSFLRSLLICFFVLGSFYSSAQAEIFYYKDAKYGVSLTYSDTWRVVHNQKSDDVITIAAPGAGNYATCRLRVREDKRFTVYPPRYSDAIQRVHYSEDFLQSYVGEYDDVVFEQINDNDGLGRGFAGSAVFSFTSTSGPKVRKKGFVFASQYSGKVFFTECSAEESVYETFEHSFYSVLKSVNFTKEHHEYPAGHYRNFLNDAPIRLNAPRFVDVVYY